MIDRFSCFYAVKIIKNSFYIVLELELKDKILTQNQYKILRSASVERWKVSPLILRKRKKKKENQYLFPFLLYSIL